MPSVRNVRTTTSPSGGPTEASSPAAIPPPAISPPATTPGAAGPSAGSRGTSSGTMPKGTHAGRGAARPDHRPERQKALGRLLPWSFPRASGSPCRYRSSLPIGVDPSEGAGRRTCPRQPRSGGGGPCDNRGIHLRRFPGPKRHTPPRASGNGPRAVALSSRVAINLPS